MLDPAQLLALARSLCSDERGSAPDDAMLRRAVSTAYYAVFHTLLQAAAQRFIGEGQEATPAYVILYRGFDHRHVKDTCERLKVSTLSRSFAGLLGRASLSADMRDFAEAFPLLQEYRHDADYNPAIVFSPSDVQTIVGAAAIAIVAFQRADAAEKADVLALLLVRSRS